MRDLVLLQQHLRLHVVDLQAHASRRVEIQKGDVLVGLSVARMIEDRPHAAQGIGVVGLLFRALPGQRLAAFVWMSGRRDTRLRR